MSVRDLTLRIVQICKFDRLEPILDWTYLMAFDLIFSFHIGIKLTFCLLKIANAAPTVN